MICAITFDDGPSDVTPVFLEKLRKYGVKASFFVIGNNITKENEKLVKEAFDMGCEINNHSRTHSMMNEMSAEDIRAEIEFTDKKVKEITGVLPKFFRPPFIALSDTMYENIELPFICGLGASDWEPDVTSDQIAERIISEAKDGCIFLLHDMQGNMRTANALDTIIPALLDKGYEFVTVSELFERKGEVPKRNTIYSYAAQ